MGAKKKNIDPLPAARLLQVKKDSGLSYARIAKKLRDNYGFIISYSSVQRYAQGKNEIDPEFAQYAADAFGVNADWLLGKSPYKTALDEDLAKESEDRVNGFKSRRERKRLLFDLMADMSGWTVESIHVAAPYGESELTDLPPYVAVSKGDVRHELNLFEYERFIGKMLDFYDFELSHM